ncbi:MAG: AAA family ATPase, partial [Deltaproteobacteria bacterium]|nr:AAA family ATPase [Deltaproteobacteria bacterium]
MFVKHVRLKNFLSFGPQEMSVDLKPLNVLIGPNGSGKSNFLEVFELLRNASGEIAKPIRQGGGISEWLWKNGGAGPSEAMVDIVVDYHPRRPQALRYGMSFTEAAGRFKMLEEWIENDQADPGCDQPYFYYRYNQGGRPMIGVGGGDYRSLQREDVALDKSILAQLRDPDQFPEMMYLGKKFEEIRLFRPWSFAAPRLPQKT